MSYTLKIKREAKRKLQSLSSTDRLRVGTWRVIYDRQDEVRIIAVERIGPRGDVYK
ncbi:hypothetical protein [Thermithiobacillus plumbiphilus]|uniref:Type II toxin-antitoxin system RelE/ParE family toxin n=1 Tax=Thermithiobacillus plumbiphilus TaxID=1729899 RepID=A0ABU9D9B2_9PROT